MRKMQMRCGRAAPLALAAALVLVAGCSGVRSRHARPTWREAGIASWYGSDFHGRRTANGERYNMYAMTAAHKTLPLGTVVTVTHRESGRRIRVRVNDRGPFVAGRIIDLSLAAARRLGSAEAGVAPVIVEADLPASSFAAAPSAPPAAAEAHPPPLRGEFSVQIGAFMVEANARRLAEQMRTAFGEARVVPFADNRGDWWRVRVGRQGDEEEARRAATFLASRGYPGFVVRED